MFCPINFKLHSVFGFSYALFEFWKFSWNSCFVTFDTQFSWSSDGRVDGFHRKLMYDLER